VNRRLRVLEELEIELARVVESSDGRSGVSRNARWRLLPTVAAIVLLLAGVAFAASRLIKTGAPVSPSMGQPVFPAATASTGEGLAIPASVKIVGLATSDPGGGLPWGMTVFKTTQGMGCVQIGRLLDGRLGVLGQDGAFDDDARFHALPARPALGYGDCIPLDGNGQTFLAGRSERMPASGLQLDCTPESSKPGDGAPPHCPGSDEREIDYGLLGPQALSVTYIANGQARTVPTVGPQGAYLIVLPADPALLQKRRGRPRPAATGARSNLPRRRPKTSINIEQALLAAALPQSTPQQPIRKIVYRDGVTCTITATGSINNAGDPCRPAGYVPKR
jgi:hypothetical protein